MTSGGVGEGADLRVPRRATVQLADRRDTRPLHEWRHLDAYVLLGDPGSGKSESMRAEALDSDGVYVSAREFIALGVEPADTGKTLFIDGLDEMRAGSADGQAPLLAIRKGLLALDRPRFRLSCREHDWRSQTDLDHLIKVAPNGAVEQLHLEPLSHDEQRQVLEARAREVPDAQAFLDRATEHGLAGLFGNPLLLDLTIRAVATQGGLPESRQAIYELSCRELVTEHSQAHLDVRPLEPGAVDQLLDDAGLLCAVLLLSGKASLTREAFAPDSSVPWHLLPAELTFRDPAAALASKVFVTTTSGESAPRHRSIAEYLAAKAIARRLHVGLPLGRVLALMQGGDGGIVEPLRGLLGWLTVHDVRDRERLIRLDPLGVVLNGDVAAFSAIDKRVLLEALRDEARRNPWFRNGQWVSHPFSSLASPEMADSLAQVLADHSDEDAHQEWVKCVLDALRHSKPLPQLRPLLEAWVEDGSAQFRNRMGALNAWKRHARFDAAKARQWLDQLHQDQLSDRDCGLAGELLFDLYPDHIGANDVLGYWPRPGTVSHNSGVPRFWYDGMIKRTRPNDFAALANAWLRLLPPAHSPNRDREWLRLSSAILANALEQSGDQVSDQQLHDWLGIGIDNNGFSKLDHETEGRRAAQWLGERPQRLKAVAALAWRATEPDESSGRRYFWEGEQRLHGARLPQDWMHWLLQQATDAPNTELAEYCFSRVAQTAIDPPLGFDVPTMEDVSAWVNLNVQRWPRAREWLLKNWTSPLDNNWQSDHHRRERKHEAEALASKDARQKALAPHVDAIVRGTAPPQLLHQIAGAFDGRFYDISGETPELRVQDFLVTDEVTARAAIHNLGRVLDRDDLPSADEVLSLDAKGKYHLLRPPALLAARLAFEQDPQVVNTWPEPLLATLVACWLTDGIGDMPGWYQAAAESRPEVIAPLLVRHALPRLRRKGPLFVTGLWALSHEAGHAALARLVLPPLLAGFPQRASEAARRELNGSLLAALHLLDDKTASELLRRKVDHPSIDASQRICWLVADLPYRTGAAQRLVDVVGTNERRAVVLGAALHEQDSLSRALVRVEAATLSGLIEVLAPITRPQRPNGPHWVGAADHRVDTVHALVGLLAGDPQRAAADELKRLTDLPRLAPWCEHLRYSMLSQQAVAREAFYLHPSPQAAALTLANRTPANHADLLALTLDHLGEIGRRVRDADTSALTLFWRRESSGSTSPSDENDCRNVLLEKLRDRLAPLGIHVVPERLAANDKRVDLRVEFIATGKALAIPVEIKKEDNRSLWLAWRDQLQALYSNDPAADGHGIYLVLWFNHKPRSTPEGERPTSAQDLERRVTERIPLSERARLVARVMDLSLPS
jgi:hypothetical protein